MTTITIIPESSDLETQYRAICGKQQATGLTLGQALDNIEQQLNYSGTIKEGITAIIVHQFQPDRFFAQEQQDKLKTLMTQFHDTLATGESLPQQTQQELENLAKTELEAAIQRSQALLQQIQAQKNNLD